MAQKTKTKRGLSRRRRRCGCSWCIGGKRFSKSDRSKVRKEIDEEIEVAEEDNILLDEYFWREFEKEL